jgi:hypothetical protein
LLGTLDREKRLWRLTSISIGTHWGTWKGTRLPGTFEMDERGSRDGVSLSEGAHCGELLYSGPWVMKRMLWGRASLLKRVQLGNLECACLKGTLRYG